MQLEESEFTCAAAVKARKSMEVEMEDLHVQMEDISKAKQAVSVAASRLRCHGDAAPALESLSLLPLVSGKRRGGSNNPI